GGYKLEGAVRRSLDGKYGVHQSILAVSKLLADLPAEVPDTAERAFLSEAINCYRVSAYRAAIVMTWNLAFDHLLNWIMLDTARIAAFNAAILKRSSKSKVVIAKRQDFDDLKEFDTVEI